MRNDLNKCTFVGRLGTDPELRYLPNGQATVNVSMACDRQWMQTDASGKPTLHSHVEWVRLVFYGRIAEIVGQYLKKGSQILVEGRLTTRAWTDGSNRTTTEVVVDLSGFMQMLGSPRGEPAPQEQEERPQASAKPAVVPAVKPRVMDQPFDDDIPFS